MKHRLIFRMLNGDLTIITRPLQPDASTLVGSHSHHTISSTFLAKIATASLTESTEIALNEAVMRAEELHGSDYVLDRIELSDEEMQALGFLNA
jgi:hypothetical protein